MSDKKTLIISAFPGCGKTYLFNHQNEFGYTILDSDSSKFSKTSNWEKEYVDHITSNIGCVDFIFISQHEAVLEELNGRGIPFVTVGPHNDTTLISTKEATLIKQQWVGRFVLRDNSHIKNWDEWITKLSRNYDEWTTYEHMTQYHPVAYFPLQVHQYLSDIIEDLYWKKENFACYTDSKDYKELINTRLKSSNK